MEIKTMREAWQWASSFLNERGLERPVADRLLFHYLQLNRTQFMLQMDEPIEREVVERLKSDLKTHASGVPVQHIIGYEEFFGRRFIVNRDVLIPRPETEELIVAVMRLKHEQFADEKVTMVDVGTGSGAISVTLALELGGDMLAVDLSEKALAVAKENASTLGADVHFIHGDLLQPLIKKGQMASVIVSNPPYIPLSDHDELAVQVREYEPHLALFGGKDGLDLYRRFVEELPAVVTDQAIIAFEVGVGQAERVRAMLASVFPKAKTDIIIDINGKERIVTAYGEMR